MQATAWLKITAPQNVIIEEVKDAAAASGTVTEHVWNEFLRITGLWYQYYIAYLDQTSQTAFLPSGIVQGDLLYGSASNVLSRLAKSTTAKSFLENSGTNNNPEWSTLSLADLSNSTGRTVYSPTQVGWTGGFTYNTVQYQIIQNIITIHFQVLALGSGTTCTMTIPSGKTSLNLAQSYYNPIVAQNNGINSIGVARIVGNTNVIDFYPTGAFGAWTTGTNRLIGGIISFPLN